MGIRKAVPTGNDNWKSSQDAMMHDLVRHGIRDTRVLDAMRRVQRHRFLPNASHLPGVYGDHPLPIGYGQTISQPFIVAYMTEKLGVEPGERILEIGAGSGYQSAVLAALGAEVYSVEIVPELARHARTVLAERGYATCHVRLGDGYAGWAEEAPFDAIIGTCCPEAIPYTLLDQLRVGGRMILPVGSRTQRLEIVVRKDEETYEKKDDLWVRFVPMVKQTP